VNNKVRLLIGLPGAAIVTFTLFFILAGMISQVGEIELSEDKSVEINVTRQLEDTQDVRQADLQRPVLDQPPPPPPSVQDASFRPSIDGAVGALPEMEMNLDIGTGFNPDRDAQPLVRIPPQYPDRCQTRAKPQEAVTLEFDVNPEGNVVNPRVLNSSNSCFDRAAMRSVERWRYAPSIRDGQPRPRLGVRTRVTFNLEG
jgi:periplasmic protein TonB